MICEDGNTGSQWKIGTPEKKFKMGNHLPTKNSYSVHSAHQPSNMPNE